jgi:hypothetical protein
VTRRDRRRSLHSLSGHSPTSVNQANSKGAIIKTTVSILSPTALEFVIYVTFYPSIGGPPLGPVQIRLRPKEQHNIADVVGVTFGATGYGALKLDSWFDPPGGSSDFDFMVWASLHWIAAPGLRDFCDLAAGDAESISTSFPAYTTAIPNNFWRSTILGVFNESSFSTVTVAADFYTTSGQLIETIQFTVGPNESQQKIPSANDHFGFVQWRSIGGSSFAYPYAITMENSSGDLIFQHAQEYIN